MRYLPLADLNVLSVSRNTFAQEHQKKNYAGVVALMADISKTAGKVVYEYYFATQGASRMNASKSLSQKLKKTFKVNLIMLIAHQ